MSKLKISIGAILILLFISNAFGQTYEGNQEDIDKILANIESFSKFYMNGEFEKLAASYTHDGKIFPDKVDIIAGHEDIQKRWTLPENVKVLRHKITPIEIKIENKTAYDHGYYEGETQRANGEKVSFKGKYVIVWKKVGDNWKIYLDIWNRIN